MPYVRGNMPYVRGNTPYVRGNTPYVRGNTPYVGGNTPYVGGNTLFLMAVSALVSKEIYCFGGDTSIAATSKLFLFGRYKYRRYQNCRYQKRMLHNASCLQTLCYQYLPSAKYICTYAVMPSARL